MPYKVGFVHYKLYTTIILHFKPVENIESAGYNV